MWLISTSCALFVRPARSIIGPAPAKLGAVAVQFASTSGSLIHAWLIPGRRGDGAVLLLHGVGANRTSMLGRAEFLHDSGYTVLLPDFQAHGESPGKHITFGALEALDAEASLAFLRQSAPDERVGVIGVSMGGAAAVLGPHPLRVDAFVLESMYPTIDDAVTDRLTVWLGPLWFAAPALSPFVISDVGDIIGVRESQLRPIDRMGQLGAPVFFASGTADRYTTPRESTELYDKATTPKELWEVPGAGHEDLHAYAPAEYERRISAFLARYLRAGQS